MKPKENKLASLLLTAALGLTLTVPTSAQAGGGHHRHGHHHMVTTIIIDTRINRIWGGTTLFITSRGLITIKPIIRNRAITTTRQHRFMLILPA
jgi:hypothetical protein